MRFGGHFEVKLGDGQPDRVSVVVVGTVVRDFKVTRLTLVIPFLRSSCGVRECRGGSPAAGPSSR